MEEEKENKQDVDVDLISCKLSSGRPVRNTKRLNYLLFNKGITETKTDCIKEPSDIGNKSKTQLARMAKNSDTKLLTQKPNKKTNRKIRPKEMATHVANHNPGDLNDEIAPHFEGEMDPQKGQKATAKKVEVIYNPKIIHTSSHANADDWWCNKCDITFLTRALMRQHKRHVECNQGKRKHVPQRKESVDQEDVLQIDESKTNTKLATKNILKDGISKLKNNYMEERPVRNFKRLPQKNQAKDNLIKMDEEDSSTHSPKKKVKSSSNQTVMKTKNVEEKPTNIEKVPDLVEELEDGEDNSTSKSNSNEKNDSTTTNNHRKLRDRGHNNNTITDVKEGSQCCSNTKSAAKDYKKIKINPSSLSDLSLRAFMAKDDICEESGEESEKELKVSKKELKVQKDCIVKLVNFCHVNQINFKPRSPTRTDGNCWFRSILDQLELHQVPNLPTTHKQLRIEVSNFLNHLPDNIAQHMIDVIFKGRKKGLKDLSYRQKKPGQFVDDNGIMVIATALFVGRRILVHREDLAGVHVILPEYTGGEGSENFPPLTVFYFKEEQHYQSICQIN